MRLDQIESSTANASKKLDDLTRKLGDPSGFLTFSGTLKTTPDEVKEAFKSSASFDLESVQMDAQFSNAIYMGLRPDADEKIRELLSEAQVEYLRTLLEQYKRLDDMIGASEERLRQSAEIAAKARADVSINLEAMASHATRKIARRLAESSVKLDAQGAQVEKALAKVTEIIKEAEAFKSRADNIIKSKGARDKMPFSITKK